MHKLFILVCVTVFEFAYCGRQDYKSLYSAPYDDGIFLKGAQIGLGISLEKGPPGKYDKDDYKQGDIVVVKPGSDEYGMYGYGYDDKHGGNKGYAYDSGYGGAALEKIPVYAVDKYAGLSKLAYGGNYAMAAAGSDGGYGKGEALYSDEAEQQPSKFKDYSESAYGGEGLSVIPGKFKEIYFDSGYGKLDSAPYKKSYYPAKSYIASADPYDSGRSLDYSGKAYIQKPSYGKVAPLSAYAKVSPVSDYEKVAPVSDYGKVAQLSDYGSEDIRAAYSKAYDRLAAYEKEAMAVPLPFGRGYDSGYDEEAPPRYAARYQ